MSGTSVHHVRLSASPGCIAGVLSLVLIGLTSPAEVLAQCGGGGGGGGAAASIERRSQAKIRADYDREQDMTVVRFGPVADGDDMPGVGASYECPGKDSCVPIFVQVMLHLPGAGTKGEAASGLVLSADDGLLLEPAYSVHELAAERTGARRQVAVVTLSVDEFLSLAGSGDLAYRLGDRSVRLTARQVKALGEFGARIRQSVGG